MLGWVADVEKATLENTNFRTVLFTGEHTQLTVMSIEPGGEIGWEAHHDIDQFLRVEQGTGRAEFGATEDRVDETHDVEDDWAIIVPAGVWHNVVNTGGERPEDLLALQPSRAPRRHGPRHQGRRRRRRSRTRPLSRGSYRHRGKHGGVGSGRRPSGANRAFGRRNLTGGDQLPFWRPIYRL